MFVKKQLYTTPFFPTGGFKQTTTLPCWVLVEITAQSGEWEYKLWDCLVISSIIGHTFPNPGTPHERAPLGLPHCPSASALSSKNTFWHLEFWAFSSIFECRKRESLRRGKYEGFFSILYGNQQGNHLNSLVIFLTQAAWLSEKARNYFHSRLSAWPLPSAQWAAPSLWLQNLK